MLDMLDDTWTTGKSDMKTIAAAVLMMMVAGVLPASGQQGRPGAVPVPMAEAAPSAGEGVSGSEAAVRPGGRPGGAQRGDVTASVLLGSLLDGTTGQPLQSATVEVRSAADSSLVAGALTSAEGRFRVAGLEPGVYYVRATMIGYAPAIVDDIAMAAGATRQLEPVRLGVSAVMLQGLEVAVERAAVRMEVDRTVFSARNLPSAAGGSATDVLRNVPSVDVDGDGQVSVRGSTNVVIQINGRTAPFRGDALNLFLRQLPAGTIDRIEVLPNPAARYDPEGMSGIVNIVLRQDANLGLSAGITAAASSADRFNGSGTVGYQRGRTTLAGMYSLNSDVRRPTAFMQRLNRFGAGETVVQDTRNRQESLGQSLMASIDYQVRPTTTLSLQASGNVNGSDGLALSDYRLLDAALAPGRSWNSGTGTERDLRAGDVTLGMRRVMAAGRNETSFEARLSGSGDESEALYGDADLASIRDLRRNETTNRDASLQFDATRLLAGIRVESGARAEQRLIDTDLTLRRSAGAPVDASRSNAFEYESRIYAGYTQLSRAFGPLSVQAGARLEHADTRFDLRTLEEAYDNRYTSLYPSASALYDMGSGPQRARRFLATCAAAAYAAAQPVPAAGGLAQPAGRQPIAAAAVHQLVRRYAAGDGRTGHAPARAVLSSQHGHDPSLQDHRSGDGCVAHHVPQLRPQLAVRHGYYRDRSSRQSREWHAGGQHGAGHYQRREPAGGPGQQRAVVVSPLQRDAAAGHEHGCAGFPDVPRTDEDRAGPDARVRGEQCVAPPTRHGGTRRSGAAGKRSAGPDELRLLHQ
jgi:hypothetical protein